MAAAQFDGAPVTADALTILNSRIDEQNRATRQWREEARETMRDTHELVKQFGQRVAKLETYTAVDAALTDERKRAAKANADLAHENDADARADRAGKVTLHAAKLTVIAMLIAAVVSGFAGDIMLAYLGVR